MLYYSSINPSKTTFMVANMNPRDKKICQRENDLGQDVREYEGQFMAQLNCFQQVFPVYLWLRYVIPFAQSKEDKQNYRNIKQK